MNFKTPYVIQGNHNKEYKDRLFKAIFGRDTEQSKRWRLDLYNALNDSNYTDPDALELNTIENVIYIKMYNDVSFLIDSQMTLYEQQSSPNPNMPMRGLIYLAELYQKHIAKEGKKLISEQLIKIPNPNFVVFYNGRQVRPEQYDLKLSDAFIHEDKSGRFEWTAHVININENRNLSLQKKCKSLYDYIQFTSRIKENKDKGMPTEKAIDEAIDWASQHNLLEGYIREQKAEVRMTLLTEYDEEASIRGWLRDGVIQGKLEDAANMLKKKYPTSDISEITGLPLEQVMKLQKQIPVKA